MAPVEPASNVTIQVEVAFSPAPRKVALVALTLPAGSSVKDALLGCRLLNRAQDGVQGLSVEAISDGHLALGIWGRKTSLGHVLRDRDRVEVYRALVVDPKEARRVRNRAHGEKLPKGIRRPK
jgi:hypothetical protein